MVEFVIHSGLKNPRLKYGLRVRISPRPPALPTRTGIWNRLKPGGFWVQSPGERPSYYFVGLWWNGRHACPRSTFFGVKVQIFLGSPNSRVAQWGSNGFASQRLWVRVPSSPPYVRVSIKVLYLAVNEKKRGQYSHSGPILRVSLR